MEAPRPGGRGSHLKVSDVFFFFPRQNLEQRWRAQLRPPAGEAEGPSAQGQGGGVFLRGHDCPQHPHGHETPGPGRGVPPHRQVSGAAWSVLHLQRGLENSP